MCGHKLTIEKRDMTRIASDPLDPDEIKANLKTRRIGVDCVVYNRTSSTSNIAWEYAENKQNNGVVIFAEEQTAGRGRGANKWFSGWGESVLCSIVLLDCEIAAELLTLTCAVATAEAIGRCGNYEPKIKWPNDVIVNERKIAGILVESKKQNSRANYVLGIGINCHQTPDTFPADIKNAATSIDVESNATCDRNLLAKRLLISIDDWLVAASQDSEKVVQRWHELSTLLGQAVILRYNKRKFTGHCIGIDPAKGLIVQLDTGGVRFFDAAHTTIIRQK